MDKERLTTMTDTRKAYRLQIQSTKITISRTKLSTTEKERELSSRSRRVQYASRTSSKSITTEIDHFKKKLELAMKERLWLERQLAFLTQSLQNSCGVDVGHYVHLTKTNQTLLQQVEYLTNVLHQQQSVQQDLKNQKRECEQLRDQLNRKAQTCAQLVIDLEKAVEKNAELTALSIEAQQQLQQLQQQMKDVAEQRRLFEKEHEEVKAQLRQRQDEIATLHRSKEAEKKKSAESIEILESKLRELEKKCELQNVRHEELVLEMDALRRTQAKKEISNYSKDHQNGLDLLDENINDLNHSMTGSTYSSSKSLNDSGREDVGSTTVPPRPSTPKSVVTLDAISEIDRIMAKLEQDNRILAELDRTRASIGLTTTSVAIPSSSTVEATAPNISIKSSSHGSSVMTTTTSNSTVTTKGTATTTTTTSSATPTTSNITSITTSVHQQNVSLPIPTMITDQLGTSTLSTGMTLPTIVTTSVENDVVRSSADGTDVPIPSIEDPYSFLDIPGVGQIQVYVARYSYDPLQHSPNENPEAELAVNAGDYILVSGDMDEDGFFDGQMLDGRKGLVPSNFVEKLTGEDLVDFQMNVLCGARESDDNVTSLPLDFSMDCNLDDGQLLIESCLPGDVLCLSNLDNIEEGDELLPDVNGDGPEIFFSALVPPPMNLTLERQFHKSILISWIAPNAPLGTLEAFNVYVDGELRVSVLANEKQRALVERVDNLRPHRISVRSVTPNRRMSVDAACTMIIGKGVPVAPSCVRASSITSTSAIISWLPSNSNYQHVVCVNSVEVRVVKPGVYRHTITGLSPNTTYRVTVKVKNIKSPFTDEKTAGRLETSSTSVDFRTLPKGLPDPPLDVQVEPGPQDGMLLVTWLPVTITTSGTSNGSQVTGYAVYADGKKVVDIDSPTGDHALLEITKLQSLTPKHVTVRTKSGDSVSSDSVQVPIPSLLPKQPRSKPKQKEPEEEYQEDSSDRSELSDIAEEEEEVSDVQQQGRASVAGTKDRKKNEAVKNERGLSKKQDHRKSRKDQERIQGAKVTTSTSRGSTERRPDQRRQDSIGQTVIEPEENLSDKEVYPSAHGPIPAIEITKDSGSDRRNSVDYSDDEYSHRRDHARGQAGGPMRDGRDSGRMEKRQGRGPDVGGVPSGKGRRPVRGDHVGPPQRDHHAHPPPRNMRTFVALFDYDPKTMSPNPGAAMEELPFREGQLIKIFGEKDPDGFYLGEAGGRQGLVPCNMVSQVQGGGIAEEDNVPPSQNRRAVPPPRRFEPSSRGYSSRKFSGRESGRGEQQWSDNYDGLPVKKMVALYDYDPQELSPNVDAEDVELSFNTGDVIYVYGEMDEDGFFMGEMNGIRGLVPSNFLTEAPADYPEDPPKRLTGSGRGPGPQPTQIGTSSGKGYDGGQQHHHGMERRPAVHPDSNKYNQTRNRSQRW